MQQKIQVNFQYPVLFTEQVFKEENLILRNTIESGGNLPAKVLVVVDQNVVKGHSGLIEKVTKYFKLHKDVVSGEVAVLTLPGGEACKNDFSNVFTIVDAVNRNNICRHSYIIGVGGGAILDLTGFAASISHRGVRLIRVPTTVLSQNDSGVGVKNGVNYLGKKNFLGCFSPPFAVINDFEFLNSLSDRDWKSGISEAIKVALIKDESFFRSLQSDAEKYVKRETGPMRKLIKRCAELHLEHISGADPFESGSSRPLDFGHWAAHKLEQISDYELTHGEAVAIGISLDSAYSFLMGMLAKEDLLQILSLFKAVELKFYSEFLNQEENVLQGLQEFREHLGGKLTVMLLEGIGKGKEVNEIDKRLVEEAIFLLKKFEEEFSELGSFTL